MLGLNWDFLEALQRALKDTTAIIIIIIYFNDNIYEYFFERYHRRFLWI